MNTLMIAQAMVAQAGTSKRNVTLSQALGKEFFWRKEPMVAPQKDGRFSVVVNDDLMADLDESAAATEVAQRLVATVFMDGAAARARLDAILSERGWQ